jgi:hypothetical protein
MLQACSQGVDLKVDRHFGERQDEQLNSFPFCVDNFDVIDVLRCPNCDELFERGKFVVTGRTRAGF